MASLPTLLGGQGRGVGRPRIGMQALGELGAESDVDGPGFHHNLLWNRAQLCKRASTVH